MKESVIVKDIYNYNSVICFLSDFFLEQKQKKGLSKTYFAQKCGFSNHSILSMIVSGKRKITESSAKKLIKVIGLEENKKDYFWELINFSQAKTIEDRDKSFRKMNIIRQKANFGTLNTIQYRFFDNWYNPIVKEIVTSGYWDESFKTLAKLVRPNITEIEAKKSFELLVDIGLIKKENGKYIAQNSIIYGDKLEPYVLNKARRDMIMIARNVGEVMTNRERYIYSATISLDKKSIEKVNELLNNFQKKIEEIIVSQDDNIDFVEQLNIQFFPVSYNLKEKR